MDPDRKVYIEDYAQAEFEEFLTCYRKRAREKFSRVPDVQEQKPKRAYVPERESLMPEGIGPSERKILPF